MRLAPRPPFVRPAAPGTPRSLGSDGLLVLVVAAALAFDFTTGFHDTANAMATSIATRALKPRLAVALSAVLKFARSRGTSLPGSSGSPRARATH